MVSPSLNNAFEMDVCCRGLTLAHETISMRQLQWRDRASLALASRYAIHHSYQSAFYTVNDCVDRYIASNPALNEALP